jgi:hypothetical protein
MSNVEELKAQVNRVTDRLEQVSDSSSVEGLDDLKTELNNLKSLLIDNPEKAVTLPLMKKDIVGIQAEILECGTTLNSKITLFGSEDI